MITNTDAAKPKRCLSKFAGMRCQHDQGHMIKPPFSAHANAEWRWNSRMQWTEQPLTGLIDDDSDPLADASGSEDTILAQMSSERWAARDKADKP